MVGAYSLDLKKRNNQVPHGVQKTFPIHKWESLTKTFEPHSAEGYSKKRVITSKDNTRNDSGNHSQIIGFTCSILSPIVDEWWGPGRNKQGSLLAISDQTSEQAGEPVPVIPAGRLRDLGISLTETSPALSALITVISTQCNVPVSLITLLDDENQWHKARIGIDDISYPIDQSFCIHAVESNHTLKVSDASKDIRFRKNPLVTAEEGIRAYAGVPIRLKDGPPIGAICAISPFPKEWTDQEVELLQSLSLAASKILELEANEKKLAELSTELDVQLERSSLFSFYFEKLQEGIVIQDEESNILEANPAAAKALGLTLNQLLGKDSFDPNWRIFEPDGRPVAPENQPSNIALKTGKAVWDVVLGVELPDRSQRWISINSQPIFRDGMDKPFRTATTFMDVTQKREQEIELIQKTKELANAAATAEAASAAKSAFLANMSHELRTPLNGIVGVASVLANSDLDDHQKEIVDLIRSSGEALGQLLNDTLDLSRIEAAQFELNPAPFNLKKEMRAAVDLFRVAASEKGLSFETDIKISDRCNGHVIGDAARIRQIASNLIANAVKFTQKGRVKVRIRLRNDPGKTDGCLLSLMISDTGLGITRAQISNLFERFHQGDISITRKYGGTGLGLAISQELAGAMGGRISVRSRPDHGSVFRLQIPLNLAHSREPVADEKPDAVTLPPRLRVLVAEDHIANQTMLRLILDAANCDFRIVETGQQAINAFAEEEYDRVILDMHMPELDGVETAKQMRRMTGGQDAVILMLTADTTEASTKAAMGSGIDKLLHKPITAHGLIKALMS